MTRPSLPHYLSVPGDVFGIGTFGTPDNRRAVLRCLYYRDGGWHPGIVLDRPLVGPRAFRLFDVSDSVETSAEIEHVSLSLLDPEVGLHLLVKLAQHVGAWQSPARAGAPCWRLVDTAIGEAWELFVPGVIPARDVSVYFVDQSVQRAWNDVRRLYRVAGLGRSADLLVALQRLLVNLPGPWSP